MALVAWWKLDGNSKDTMGNYDGIDHGTLTYINGILGECLSLDGTANTGIELMRQNDASKFENYFSFVLWFKSNSTSDSDGNRIVSRDCSDYWCWYLYQSQSFPQDLRFYYSNTQSTLISNAIQSGWNHLASTWNLETGEVKMYINGILEFQATDFAGFTTSARPIVIGGNTEGDGDISGSEVVGDIDDVRAYNHILSLKEIKELNRALAAHWKFDYLAPGGLVYEWYETSTYYDNNSHPTITSELDAFFNSSNSGVNFGGSGLFLNEIYWRNTTDWNPKPDYLPDDGFSWKGEGYIYCPETGTYSFAIDSDDAGDVLIDDTVVCSWYDGHGIDNVWIHSGTTTLTQGYHKIKARMEEGGGGDGIGVAWMRPSDTSFYVIPSNYFYYKNSFDSSGGDNNGEYNNNLPTWTTNTAIGNGSYYFDGNQNRIVIPHSPYIDIDEDELTITYWQIFEDAGDQDHPTITKSSETGWAVSTGWQFGHGWGVTLYSGMVGSGLSSTDVGIRDDGNWYFVVHRYKNGDGLRVYVNGILEVHDTSFSGQIGSNTHDVWIGDSERGGQYKGNLDDVRIYAKALSEDDINELYQQRTSIDNKGNFYEKELVAPREKLLIDEQTKNIYDNDYNSMGTWNVVETDVSSFEESDDTLGNFVIEGWIYCSSPDYTLQNMEYTKDNNDRGFRCRFENYNNITSGWTYIQVIVISGDKVSYLNAANAPWNDMTRLEFYRTGPSTGTDTSQFITVKDWKLRKFTNNEIVRFNVDNTGILKALNFSEVGTMSNIIGWWKLDNDALDYSGSGNDGNIYGAFITSGLGQSSYEFDGSDDYIETTNNIYLGTSPWTVFSWYYPKSSSDYGHIFTSSADQGNFACKISQNLIPYFFAGSDFRTETTGVPAISLDEWSCLAYIFDGATVKIYHNGNLIVNESNITPNDIPSSKYRIQGGNNEFVNAKHQNVRLYEIALTSEEVNILYNLTNPNQKQRVIQSENQSIYIKNELIEY